VGNKCLPEDPVINNYAIIGIVIILGACVSTALIYCCMCRKKDGNTLGDRNNSGRRRSGGRDVDNIDQSSLLN
jgi:hypothetical protein